jgi:uncharacterized protein YjdB
MKPIAKLGEFPFSVGGISVFAAVDKDKQAITDELFILQERSTRYFDLINEGTDVDYTFMKMVSKDTTFRDLDINATAAEVQALIAKNQFVVKVYDQVTQDPLGYVYKFFTNKFILSNGLEVQVTDFAAQTAVPVAPVVPVASVSLNKITSAILTGATEQLTATVLPADATDKSVTWASDAPTIATVSATGLVTAVANGAANITVTTTDGAHTSTCAYTITTAVTGVTVAPKTVSLSLAGTTTQQLTPTVAPATASNTAVIYSSDTPATATVSATGLITAVAIGTSTIKVMTDDGAASDTCVVTVTA